ncbi:MAG: glycosyltransferase family 39 protein, partial [Planctomycetaceae bacterium]
MSHSPRLPLTSHNWFGPAVAAALTLFAVTITLDPSDCRPGMPEGPGITLDESFNVQMGVYIIEAIREYGLSAIHPGSLQEFFHEDQGYNPDHPPLGRAWLGLFHTITQTIAPTTVQGPFVTVSARVGSAFAFALTILAVGWMTACRFGTVAGTLAATSLALMPRLFGHAHLASLETVTGLSWTLTVLSTALLWSKTGGPDDRVAAGTGVLFGLVLLTKIQAVILPPLIVLWALSHWRMKAIRPLVIWGTAGGTVFLIGWPWLWTDLTAHTMEYFGRTTDRAPLNVYYLGRQFLDRNVPWHYPWLMFLVTVPPGLHLFAAAGIFRFGR